MHAAEPHAACYVTEYKSVGIKKKFVVANSINSFFHQCFAGLSNNVVTLLVDSLFFSYFVKAKNRQAMKMVGDIRY